MKIEKAEAKAMIRLFHHLIHCDFHIVVVVVVVYQQLIVVVLVHCLQVCLHHFVLVSIVVVIVQFEVTMFVVQ
jgi:hypothetical protein